MLGLNTNTIIILFIILTQPLLSCSKKGEISMKRLRENMVKKQIKARGVKDNRQPFENTERRDEDDS